MAETPLNADALAVAIASLTKGSIRRGLSKTQFNRVFELGRRANGALCRCTTLPGEGRFAFATAKAIGCHARRNRLKRRVREAFKLRFQNGVEGFDVVVSANAVADRAKFSDLANDVEATVMKSVARWDEE